MGTHEQQFDRLIRKVDEMKSQGIINEPVYTQIGYSNYIPKSCEYSKLIGYDEMDRLVREARIVITHGGPGSIFHPIQYGKPPIVVPRNPKFNEHVDFHQIEFAKFLHAKGKIIPVYDIDDLEVNIINYDILAENINSIRVGSNIDTFIDKFEKVIDDLFINNKKR